MFKSPLNLTYSSMTAGLVIFEWTPQNHKGIDTAAWKSLINLHEIALVRIFGNLNPRTKTNGSISPGSTLRSHLANVTYQSFLFLVASHAWIGLRALPRENNNRAHQQFLYINVSVTVIWFRHYPIFDNTALFGNLFIKQNIRPIPCPLLYALFLLTFVSFLI